MAATGAAAAGPAADTAHDGGGSAVISGFVDSHFDLVFAGDRAQEFAARMTSTPYSSGGTRTTVAATGGGEAEDSRPEAQGEKRS